MNGNGAARSQFCIPIKYCPFCGRPLTEEAWAELERRIGEDIGLEPEEIMEMKRAWKAACNTYGFNNVGVDK